MLKMMTLNSENIIDDLTATLWATALNHKDMYDEESPILNPFFYTGTVEIENGCYITNGRNNHDE